MDIIRRLLEDYFGYDVFMQVNVTDIDDKIILRARRNKLIEDYVASISALAQVRTDVGEAVDTFEATQQKKLTKLEQPLPTRREEDERQELFKQHQLKMENFAATKATIASLSAAADCDAVALVRAAAEPLAEMLDKKIGEGVTQHEIFDAHARKYEAEFLQDMVSLNVRSPDALTRVTEYVPQIIDFVEKIVAKGLAYESNGSVYMDIAAFRAKGHEYPKLEPSKGQATEAEMAESEGSLHSAEAGEKRTASDFALWKKSKGGEPQWDSPWGGGRPGWHIECSVMASDLLGDNMDVHAGGSDLKFPHHDNELCQSEALHGCCQWVNYFWHFGHLHIKGLKMSKSLKNFTTIREALQIHTPRQIRLMFLLQPWDKPINYSDQTLDEAVDKESKIDNFFGRVKAVLREAWTQRRLAWGEIERDLNAKLMAHQQQVHECLCDNFNTGGAMLEIMGIVGDGFSYLRDNARPDALLLKKMATYVTRMMRIFGVVVQEEFGFPIANGGGDYEENVAPVVTALVDFRDAVRAAAKQQITKEQLLALCDSLRDTTLVELGIRCEDQTEGAIWKLDDPETLRQEVRTKEAAKAEQVALKALNRLGVKTLDLTKAIESSVSPTDVFKLRHAAKYFAFDEQGKPTADAKGEALSKGGLKDVEKEVKRQTKLYAQHQAALEKSPDYIGALRAALRASSEELSSILAAGGHVLGDETRGKMQLALEAAAKLLAEEAA